MLTITTCPEMLGSIGREKNRNMRERKMSRSREKQKRSKVKYERMEIDQAGALNVKMIKGKRVTTALGCTVVYLKW